MNLLLLHLQLVSRDPRPSLLLGTGSSSGSARKHSSEEPTNTAFPRQGAARRISHKACKTDSASPGIWDPPGPLTHCKDDFKGIWDCRSSHQYGVPKSSCTGCSEQHCLAPINVPSSRRRWRSSGCTLGSAPLRGGGGRGGAGAGPTERHSHSILKHRLKGFCVLTAKRSKQRTDNSGEQGASAWGETHGPG